jgi:addiction module HigA family antidote
MIMTNKRFAPIHPGVVLAEDFLKPMNLSQYRLAQEIHVSPRRINEIVHGTRSITADTALRMGRFFGVSPQFWMNLQSRFDLDTAEDQFGARIEREVEVHH